MKNNQSNNKRKSSSQTSTVDLQRSKMMKQSHYDRRLCLRNVPKSMTKSQIMKMVEDFEEVVIYMPINTHNKTIDSKLVFMDFQKPWEAKVARKLINLINLNNISAEFAIVNEKECSSSIPLLAKRKTVFPHDDVPSYGSCAYCLSPKAQLVCEVCFSLYCATFYCNEDHQRRDWARHKFDCKPLPKLVPSKEAEDAVNESKPKVKFVVPFAEGFKTGASVVIMNVVSERVLFMRLVNEGFDELLGVIKTWSDKASKLVEKPGVNDTVLCPFKGNFCRAQIVDTFERDSEGFDVLCFILDFGFTIKETWNSLKKLGYKQRAMPRQTFKVILEGLQLENVTEEVKSYVDQIWKNEEELTVVKEEMRGAERFVVLKRRGSDKTINDHCIRLMTIDDTTNDDRIFYKESKIVKITTGQNVKIRVTDVSCLKQGYITCMLAEKTLLSWKLDKEINSYGNTNALNETYTPMLDELCLVRNDERWERASAVELGEEEISVMLLDKFVLKTVDVKNVYRLPAKFATNFYTQLCSVRGITDENFELAQEKLKPRTNIFADLVTTCEDDDEITLVFKALDSSN